jgi:hypothetical protein
MQFNVDKRFIQILNNKGASITWEQFRAAYDVRKAERENTPEAKKRRARQKVEDEMEFLMLKSQLAAIQGVSGA